MSLFCAAIQTQQVIPDDLKGKNPHGTLSPQLYLTFFIVYLTFYFLFFIFINEKDLGAFITYSTCMLRTHPMHFFADPTLQ
jgi:hypothetical protein